MYATLVIVVIFVPCMFLLATAIPAFLFAARGIPWPWKPLALPGVIAAYLLAVAVIDFVYMVAERVHGVFWKGN